MANTQKWMLGFICLAGFLACAPWNPKWTQLWLFNTDTPDLWQFITAHFAHWSWAHWLVNLVAFLSFVAIYSRYLTAKSCLTVTLSLIFFCDVYLYTAYERSFYLGFSAVLYGLFTFAAMTTYRQAKLINTFVIIYILYKTISDWAAPSLENIYGIAVAFEVHGAAIYTAIMLAIIKLKLR